MSALRAFAAAAPAAVFAAIGENASDRVDDLCLRSEINRVTSPRHASVLLVAGVLRDADRDALRRVHDQLPHPRATLWWTDGAPVDGGVSLTVRMDDDPAESLQELQRQLMTGERHSEADLLPNEPPAPWRGVGEYGQGGKGMMGGTPYGRPMPMPADDLRDGLALDAYTMRIGPFMPMLPAGLVISLTLQGDVIQHARMESPPLWAASGSLHPRHGVPATLAQSERLLAARHLRCVARLLVILQLMPQAERCRRMACAVEHGEAVSVAGLRKSLIRSGAFAAIPAGLGRLDPRAAQALGGTTLRAAGGAIDVRQRNSAYQALHFCPVAQLTGDVRGDVRARLCQWLDEADQSVALAARAGSAPVEGALQVDRDIATDTAPVDREDIFSGLLAGLEWNEAMLVINSFDIATLRWMCPSAPSPPDAASGQHEHAM